MTNNTNAKDKDVDDVVYGYSTDISYLEEENRVLRDTVSRLKEELDRLRKSPLLVCEVREVIENNAMIRLPNGNLFFVSIGSTCEKLNAGDYVLAEQKKPVYC